MKFLLALILPLLILALVLTLILQGNNVQIFNPKGIIALKESQLIQTHIFLMLVIVIPTLIVLIITIIRYREKNSKAKYLPNSPNNKLMEIMLWIVPSLIIGILALNTWKTTHQLDPHKPISSPNQLLTIQVVALQWKWLFIYPDQNISTINFIQFPINTPIHFKLTADAPMNSFWIPQLGGQIYAMAGMGTQLNLLASYPGEYQGSGAEMSGQGFAGMKFMAKASSQSDFNAWVGMVKQSPNKLDLTEYNQLSKPSENNPIMFYSSAEPDLYNKIIMKFMAPPSISPAVGTGQEMPDMPKMNY